MSKTAPNYHYAAAYLGGSPDRSNFYSTTYTSEHQDFRPFVNRFRSQINSKRIVQTPLSNIGTVKGSGFSRNTRSFVDYKKKFDDPADIYSPGAYISLTKAQFLPPAERVFEGAYYIATKSLVDTGFTQIPRRKPVAFTSLPLISEMGGNYTLKNQAKISVSESLKRESAGDNSFDVISADADIKDGIAIHPKPNVGKRIVSKTAYTSDVGHINSFGDRKVSSFEKPVVKLPNDNYRLPKLFLADGFTRCNNVLPPSPVKEEKKVILMAQQWRGGKKADSMDSGEWKLPEPNPKERFLSESLKQFTAVGQDSCGIPRGLVSRSGFTMNNNYEAPDILDSERSALKKLDALVAYRMLKGGRLPEKPTEINR